MEDLILHLDFQSNAFRELEKLQCERKLEQIWKVAAKHSDNAQLVDYINRFITLQVSFNQNLALNEEAKKQLQLAIERESHMAIGSIII